MDKETVYEEQYLTNLGKGQIIAIGTDGIWEAMSSKGEMFGKRRFRRIIREHSWRSAQEILDTVYSELEDFTLGMKNEDDITLVIVKVVDLNRSSAPDRGLWGCLEHPPQSQTIKPDLPRRPGFQYGETLPCKARFPERALYAMPACTWGRTTVSSILKRSSASRAWGIPLGMATA